MALEERGYMWAFMLPGREVNYPRFEWMIGHDPGGVEWPSSEALISRQRIRRGRLAGHVPDQARRFYGHGVPVYGTRFKVPAPGVRWRKLGACEWIFYDRTGVHEGPFYHPFKPPPPLLVGDVDGQTFYRLQLGNDCILDERGFVKP